MFAAEQVTQNAAKRKEEGGRMKDEGGSMTVAVFILPPSSFILHPLPSQVLNINLAPVNHRGQNPDSKSRSVSPTFLVLRLSQ